jgi:16S rRNA C1402 N4-methylase RsmH
MEISPIRKTDGKWARNNEQKAQRFAEHLEQIFQPLGSQEEKAMITKDIVQENEEIKLATTTEVKNVININTNPRKCTGV